MSDKDQGAEREDENFSGPGTMDKDILSITYDDFVEFLTAAGAEACEACGNERWGIGMEEGSDELAVGHIRSVRKANRASWILTASCHRCGNMRIYNANRIAKWIHDGKPEI